MRYRKALAAVAALILLGATACGMPGSASSGQDGPIKVAIIPPSSGALAQFGSDAAQAWEYAVDEVNASGGINGRKVKLIKMSTDAKPATTLRAAREAVIQRGANFIGAVMTSTEHAALNQQLESLDALSFNSLGKSDTLTGKDCSPNAFRVVQSNTMDINALAAKLSKLPGEKWAIQAVDYTTGHTAARIFKKAAKAAGKEVVLTQFAPLNTTEFGSYITKLKQSDADALFAVEYGADAVAFINQGAQFQLFDQFETVLGFNMVSQPLFDALGEKIVGFHNNVGYDLNADNKLNRQFVQGFKQKYGEKPYYVHADNYLAAQTLFEGIKAAGSTKPAEVRKALEGLTFNSIAGKVTMRASDHQLLRPSYLGKVVKENGKLQFDIVAEASGKETATKPKDACKA